MFCLRCDRLITIISESVVSVVLYFKIILNLNLGRVHSDMFCEVFCLFESFATFVALERPLPSVRPHVALQMTSCSAGVAALVTLVWLFSCMLPHHVLFQIACCNAGELAPCASLRLFTRVGPFVPHQIV